MAATAGVQPRADLAAPATGRNGRDDLVVTEVRLDLGDEEAGNPVRLVRHVRQA